MGGKNKAQADIVAISLKALADIVAISLKKAAPAIALVALILVVAVIGGVFSDEGMDLHPGSTTYVPGNLSVGDGTPSTTLNGEDAYVEGTFEVDGAVNFDNELNIADDLIVGNGTPDTTQNGEDAYIEGTLEVDGAVNLDGAVDMDSTLDVANGITTAVGQEHVGSLPTIASFSVISTTTDGAMFTIADGEIWIVHAILVNVTTNFDCTGDDCTLIIGDGNDTDGFIVLADAALQTTDTEGTGFAAGWQGMAAATRGVYLDEAANNAFTGGFVYAPSGAAETIDVDVGGTSPTAGAATVYIIYTRIQ